METQSVTQLRGVFDLLDRDNDGSLKQSDLRHIYAAYFMRVTEEDISALQGSLSGNKDVTLSADTFTKLLMNMNKTDVIATLSEGWHSLASPNAAIVTAGQISDLVVRLGLSITEQEVTDLILHYDRCQKGGLTFEEFANIFA